jgi:putative SOS response-associated peptidase YedK
MCGRFAQFNPVDVLKARFGIEAVTCDITPSYNIAPSKEVLALINHQGLRLGKLTWGFSLFRKEMGKKSGLIINARAETLHEKKTFAEALKKRRCLIMADGFYEWGNEAGKKIPYYFHLKDRAPFAFAGLWYVEKPRDGIPQSSCVIITRKAEGAISDIHHRMPAIIDMDHVRKWLSDDRTGHSCDTILQEHCVTDLAFRRVSELVNRASFDSPACIEELN